MESNHPLLVATVDRLALRRLNSWNLALPFGFAGFAYAVNVVGDDLHRFVIWQKKTDAVTEVTDICYWGWSTTPAMSKSQ